MRMREDFEAWASDNGAHPRAVHRGANGGYQLMSTHAAWEAWQASRAMLEVKLPESFYPDGDIECPKVVNLYEVTEELSAAGITVKGDE